MKFEERQQISRPCHDVFLALSRPDLYLTSWSRGVLSATQVNTETDGAPTKYKITGRDLAGKAHWHYEVTSCEVGKSFTARAIGGPIGFTDQFMLQQLPDGTTELIHTQEIHPRGLFTLLGPVLPYVWPSLIRHNLGRLKSVLEARKSPIPAVAVSS